MVLARLIALALLATSPAAAQDARDVTVARSEFEAGIGAARAGDWGAARGHFARSYALNPRPSALFNLAGAQAQTGALVAAAESYREYLAHRDERNADRVTEAEGALADLEARIATVTVTLDGLAPGDEVRLDGAPIRSLLLDHAIPLDPGAHRFAVTRDGAEVAAASVDAREGARLTLTIDVPPPPAPTPAEVVSDAPSEPEPPTRPPVAPAPTDDGGEDVLGSWWLWTIVAGVLTLGGAIAIGVAVTTPGDPPPSVGFAFGTPVRVP